MVYVGTGLAAAFAVRGGAGEKPMGVGERAGEGLFKGATAESVRGPVDFCALRRFASIGLVVDIYSAPYANSSSTEMGENGLAGRGGVRGERCTPLWRRGLERARTYFSKL